MGHHDAPRTGPLSGLRVLDLTRVLAGPFCTMILADLGAEVVKVERPESGDDARHFGPFLPSGLSAYFASLNRGKKSIVLDLKQTDDCETLRQLTRKADVLVENFRPGTMAAFDLAADDLRAVSPSLIYASVSGFGQHGEHAKRPAYDVIIQAMGGLMSITGTDANHPVRVGTSIGDIVAGLFATIDILAAVHERGHTAAGAALDVAMLDCSVAVLENAISRYDVSGQIPRPLGTRHPSITPFQAFPTADAPIVVAAGNDSLWRRLCQVLEAPLLADDTKLATNAARTDHHAYMEKAIGERFRRQSAAHWLARLDEAGVPSAPIRNIEEVVTDQNLVARSMLHWMVDRDGSTFRTAGSPLRTPPLSNHAPELGEHTEAVIRQWLKPT